ncbi:Oidioi.mRNA.OKI2018_I69.chr2.g5496.t1.cds [Oikopleura dioica]|uniref:Oidioi.mRNA.OKI2018_I69.chr2.g5496.t1.cds n=1 Tax=Oikopleura dioica TaxID=34765 RepID=A0ABN7T0G8_OIKDI|nr:Oidioi.mRNA.OKI2018_I69.chr2.g5496.t1.cds [Oikopleura dioica]
MKRKESDESPSSDDNSGERLIDQGESSEIDIPPLERAAEFSQPSPHFKSPEKTSNKSSNSKVAPNLDPEPTPIPQRKTSSPKESTEIPPSNTETQPSQLSRYEMMERAAEFSQRTSQEELLNDDVPSDPEISLSVSGELFDDELQPMDTAQISQQDEEEANSSQGSSVYKTPEKSRPKSPSNTDQSAPASPPQPPRKLRRRLFNENQEESMDTPEIFMASSGDTTGRSKKVEMKDFWSQTSGETLRETEGRKRRTHDALNLCAEESQEERKKKSQEGINQTQRVGDLLNHTALALDSQQSTQATQNRQESTSAIQLQPQEESQGTNEKYFTPPTSPTLEQASATQKTFDEDLDDDYFAKLKSPTRNAEIDQAKQQKRVNRKMPRSRAKPTRDEVKESVAKACRKLQAGGISGRLELARAFISRRNRARDSSDPLNRELENATSWEPKVPNVDFSKPVPGSSSRFKKLLPVAEKPAKENPGPSKSKASKSQSHERSQPREEQESANNWSQQALFDESAEDRQALSPEHDQFPPAPIDREDVREFMFPTSNKRKLQTPEKDAQGEASTKDHAAKRSKHEKENITPKKSASKPTILKPAVDNTIPRRPGRDALSEISDLSSAFDNDSPIRGVGKMKQSEKKAMKEKSAKLRHDEPTCSKNLTPPAMPPDADLSSFLNSSEDEEVRRPQSRPRRRNRSPTASMSFLNSSEDEEVRRPQSPPRRRNRSPTASMSKLTKLRSPEKSPSPSKSKKKPISMKKKHPKIIPSAARKPPRSITSSVETRDTREEYDEKTIFIKDVKNIKGRIGFRLSENSEAGIHISEVVPGSLADKAGLRAGDILICFNVIAELETEDFKFTVIRDVSDQYSEEEDVDTSGVSDISDAESDDRVQNIDSDGNESRVETPVDTNPEYGTFDNTANVTNLPSERNAADTTNPDYETFDRSSNVTAGTSEQPEPAFSGSSSDVPRPESIASNQREESDESASEVSVQPASSFKPYKCPEANCEMAFVTSGGLTKHRRSKHTDEKPFKCTLCEYASADKSNFCRHMRTHTGEQPFSCDICGKAFGSSSNLKRHEFSHTGEKPYECPHCKARFTQNSKLKRHVMQQHTKTAPKFECEICHTMFGRKSNLDVHMRNQHSYQEIPMQCRYCEENIELVTREDQVQHYKSAEHRNLLKSKLKAKTGSGENESDGDSDSSEEESDWSGDEEIATSANLDAPEMRFRGRAQQPGEKRRRKIVKSRKKRTVSKVESKPSKPAEPAPESDGEDVGPALPPGFVIPNMQELAKKSKKNAKKEEEEVSDSDSESDDEQDNGRRITLPITSRIALNHGTFLLVFARLASVETTGLVNFLDSENAFQPLMQLWLEKQCEIFGAYERKECR